MVKDQFPDAVNEATTSILPVWLEAFKTLLNVDPQQELNGAKTWDGLLVRIQIFKVRRVVLHSLLLINPLLDVGHHSCLFPCCPFPVPARFPRRLHSSLASLVPPFRTLLHLLL